MTIDRFTGQYRFLSNFFIEPDGTHVEGEFQAAKCKVPEDAEAIRMLEPGEAKRWGRSVVIRKDWDDIKIGVMHALVLHKFTDHDCLRIRLLRTNDAALIEGNHWGDDFWGVFDGSGRNELGKILMAVRSVLRR